MSDKKERIFYTIYRTTNNLTSKCYIGAHITSNLDDDYLGSGVKLNEDIELYGKENFSKEILFIFDTYEEMDEKEKELVTMDEVLSTNFYNKKLGGYRGWNSKGLTTVRNKDGSCSLISIDDERYKSGKLDPISKNMVTCRDKNGNIQWVTSEEFYSNESLTGVNKGKKFSDETRKNIGTAVKKRHKEKGHPQKGKMWITNPQLGINKLIRGNEKIPNGWIKGRKYYG